MYSFFKNGCNENLYLFPLFCVELYPYDFLLMSWKIGLSIIFHQSSYIFNQIGQCMRKQVFLGFNRDGRDLSLLGSH